MPWAASSGATTAAASQSFTDFVNWLLGIFFGRSASLDCFLQAHDILQAGHERDIISNVFARALGRWARSQPLTQWHSGAQLHLHRAQLSMFESAGFQADASCLMAGFVLCARHLQAHDASLVMLWLASSLLLIDGPTAVPVCCRRCPHCYAAPSLCQSSCSCQC
jgi:hypothetical protein